MSERISVYWLGYANDVDNPRGLTDIPAEVSIINLAFAVTCPSSEGDSITMDFLTSQHSRDEIVAGIRYLHARGQKVCMSINGNPNWPDHPGGWVNLNPVEFARNVKRIAIDEWSCDGIDLDNEANETPDDHFCQVIRELRTALGPDAIISLPVYLGLSRDKYLANVVPEISYVATMAYWNDYQSQIDLLLEYASVLTPEKVYIGVANAANPGQCTDLAIVPQLAQYQPKGGLMLWTANFKDALQWISAMSGISVV